MRAAASASLRGARLAPSREGIASGTTPVASLNAAGSAGGKGRRFDNFWRELRRGALVLLEVKENEETFWPFFLNEGFVRRQDSRDKGYDRYHFHDSKCVSGRVVHSRTRSVRNRLIYLRR